jgi:pyruvate/2-oxoacid:ferredoxin oxidoreductase beta subunit
MNTGIQRSGATPALAWTSNTAAGKQGRKKDLDGIMAAHRIPYFATVSPGFPEDMVAKMRRAIATRGFRMLHALSPCPPGWKMDERMGLEAARRAVEARVFPLYEVVDGAIWRETLRPPRRPLDEYLRLQGRFAQLDAAAIADVQRAVDADDALLGERFRASSGV